MYLNETTVTNDFENGSLSFEMNLITPKYIYVWIYVVNAVIFLTGFIGNILVIIIVIRVKNMRTTTNYCLLNLCIADLLTLLICQTSALLEFYTEDVWLLGKALCKIIPYLENVVTHASILIMMAFSFGRYYAVSRPLHSYSNFHKAKLWLLMVVLWIVAGISALPILIITDTKKQIHISDGQWVNVCKTRMHLPWHQIYLVIIFCVFFVIPFFILIYIYTRILFIVFKDSSNIVISRSRSSYNSFRCKLQLIRMLIIIVSSFFLFVLPMRIVSFWLVFSDPADVQSVGFETSLNIIWIARTLLYVNSVSNPIIYNIFSVKFRRAFHCILGMRQPRYMVSQEIIGTTRSGLVVNMRSMGNSQTKPLSRDQDGQPEMRSATRC